MLVLERAPEGNLEDKLNDIRGSDKLKLMASLLQAVAAMHDKQIVWADCKPKNFLIYKTVPWQVDSICLD